MVWLFWVVLVFFFFCFVFWRMADAIADIFFMSASFGLNFLSPMIWLSAGVPFLGTFSRLPLTDADPSRDVGTHSPLFFYHIDKASKQWKQIRHYQKEFIGVELTAWYAMHRKGHTFPWLCFFVLHQLLTRKCNADNVVTQLNRIDSTNTVRICLLSMVTWKQAAIEIRSIHTFFLHTKSPLQATKIL